MSYTDAISQITAIQDQIASLRTAFQPVAQTSAATASGTASGAASSATVGSTFSTALRSAMGTSSVEGTASTGTNLPTRASSMLTSDQQTFASQLAARTGLDPGVVSAWVLAEESGGAASSRQAQGNNDWLNIGYTDSGTYGASDGTWSNPVSAANATAGWLKGQNTIPGYGTASSGIQAILGTAGQPASTQISALQRSGWASSGYPSLPGLYSQVAG